ncbi:tol-pal system protein YbgF [Alphaproteobacteria bacterium]|nr:tol-pal system protein YbgF [Alphaproteobacteria bacterium]
MIKYIIFSLFLFFCSFSNAEDSLLTLKQQLDRLQREVNDLSKSVFTSKRDSFDQQEKIDDTTSTIDLTAFDLRIYELEKDIKKLNNSFEELIFQIDDLNQLYKELNIDLSTLSLKIENSIKKNNLEEKIEDSTTSSNSEIKEENTLGSLVINSEDLSKNDTTSQNQKVKSSEEENLPNLNPEDQFQLAFDLLRNQRFEEAKASFLVFIEENNDHTLSGTAHYWLGEIYLLKKEYREAALILAEGYQKFPQSIKAPDMLYKLSESLVLIDKKNDACSTLIKLDKEYPDNKLKSKVAKKVSELNCFIPSE